MVPHLTVWSKLLLASQSPWSWQATAHTACLCSVNVATHFCFSKLQILTLPSPGKKAHRHQAPSGGCQPMLVLLP